MDSILWFLCWAFLSNILEIRSVPPRKGHGAAAVRARGSAVAGLEDMHNISGVLEGQNVD